MDRDEHLLALSESYLQATDTLRMEELILAAMGPRGDYESPGMLAQKERITALRKVVDQFAKTFPAAGADHG